MINPRVAGNLLFIPLPGSSVAVQPWEAKEGVTQPRVATKGDSMLALRTLRNKGLISNHRYKVLRDYVRSGHWRKL
jgi:hypothetical protein